MDKILNKLYYDDKLGVAGKANFIKKVRALHTEFKVKDITEWLNNQSVSQVNTTITKKYDYKITANPKSFQVDILWWKRETTLTPVLLFVDILSRKLWAFVLSKNKDATRGENIVKCIEQLNKEIGGINALIGDAEFGNKIITEYCNDNNIRLDASVAKTEHISNGDKLGIVDRLCRTLRELIERYYDVTGNRTDNLKHVIKSAVDTYNDNDHRTIKTTPNKAWKDNNLQLAHHLKDMIHNEQVYKTVPFKSGENVRILEEKDNKFSKGKNKFSNETYKISDKTGYKISVKNDDDNKLHRKFKPAELLKVNKADNPKSKAYIEEVKADKKAGKVVNALIKNAKMSKTEALQAVAAVNEPKTGRGKSAPADYAAFGGNKFRNPKK
jgi:hypothetical protein